MLTTRIADQKTPKHKATLRLDWKRALGVERIPFPRARPRPERRLLGRLRGLEFARGPLAITQITGGMSNLNFAVRARGGAYFARLGQDRPLLGANLRNEIACHKAADALGLAPEVIHYEQGLLVTRLIEGRTLEPASVREPGIVARLAKLLRQLHGKREILTGEFLYFCPFQTNRTYTRTAARLNAKLPHDIAAILDDSCELQRRIAPFQPVLCHNDLLPANLIDDGRKLWLVDWEYGGIGHPLFDLANASATAAFSDDLDRALLELYHGHVDERFLAELRIFKVMALLRDALWGVIQTVASDLDFDYRRYADAHMLLFREARAELP
jgi:thiamine kinase-like enzyme